MWRALGLHDMFAGHDAHVTIGERSADPDCTIPTCGIDWITTPQPVVLDEWPARAARRRRAVHERRGWRGPYGPIEFGGVTYGLRVHEFRNFAELPRARRALRARARHPPGRDRRPRAARRERLAARRPAAVAGRPGAYRDYVQRSTAELMVAKNIYVATRSGWFSDRSICYLASGRPVLAQDTGI